MKSKKIGVLITTSILALSLTGCGGATQEINNLNSMQSLGSESNVTNNYNLSYSDEQNLIYAQVSDRTLLDLSTLDACSDNELQEALGYMDKIDNVLTGQTLAGQDLNIAESGADELAGSDATQISHFLTDYLLAEFEKTPYTWQRSQTIVRGIDSQSRSIIVDVTYKTLGHKKDVKTDSLIIKGEPDYATKMEVRFDRYMEILSLQYNNPTDPQLNSLWNEWRKAYGDENIIIEQQREGFPSDRIYKSGIQWTYTGLTDSPAEESGGTMTVRYVLVPDYKLGINLGLTCEHLYVIDYKLDKDITEGMQIFTEEGYATVTDEVTETMYSYFQCIDESDYSGLYSLTKNFGTLDKYYQDVFETTYSKHSGFTVSIFNIQGTEITCGVTISSKVRARGSNMTYPIYTDRYYVNLELIDDTLKVTNMTLLSRTLEGEPAIVSDEADSTGFVAGVSLNNEDKLAIEDLICKFGAVQLNNDTTSDNFGDIVDLSMSQSNLTSVKTNMTSLSGVKKVTWLQNYQQGTSNFASVKCREMFQDSTNAIIEADVTYDFINKGGKWYVYNYDVNSSVKLTTTNLSTTGSLCLVSPGKVESYTSQIRSTDNTPSEDKGDVSYTQTHESYEPKRKSDSVEQGYNKYDVADITADLWNNSSAVSKCTYEDYLALADTITDETLRDMFLSAGNASFLLLVNGENQLYMSQSDFNDDYEIASGLIESFEQASIDAGFTSGNHMDLLGTLLDWASY